MPGVSYADRDRDHRSHRSDHGRPFKQLNHRIDNIQEQIDAIESGTGSQGPEGPAGETGAQGPQGVAGDLSLAGKRCPSNLAVVGFDANGELICEAPWLTSIPPTPGTEVSYNCSENYDQLAVESGLSAMMDDITALLGNIPPIITENGTSSIEILFSPAIFAPGSNVSAPLDEFAASEPCVDGIKISTSLPDTAVTGTWDVTTDLFVTVSGTFQININAFMFDLLARLTVPDLAGASVGDTIPRSVASTTVQSVDTSGITVALNGGRAMGSAIASIVENEIRTKVADHIMLVINSQLIPQLATNRIIPSPVVTIEVVSP